MAFPDAWEETAIVTIQKLDGTAYQYAAITETIDISEPDYPVESMNNLAGGRIVKQSSMEDGEITLEIYPVELPTNANNTGLFQQYVGGTADNSEPCSTDTTWVASVDRSRDKYLVAILWTTDQSATSAVAATTATDKTGLRFYAKECRITSHKTSFTDGIVKTTVTFKFPAMSKAGTTMNFAWESTDDTDTSPLPALTYTS